jgi:hypothetical protein
MDADGDATVAVSYTFDFDDDARQAAFEELQTNETARETLTATFEQRLERVATETESETNREMVVSDASLQFETDGNTGIATLDVTWESLAAVEDGRLVVTEPFASGFETDRPLHVIVPDEYSQIDATPTPDDAEENTLTWTAGRDLTGFELVVQSNDDGSDGATGTDGESMDDESTPTDDSGDSETVSEETSGETTDTTSETTSTEASETDGNGAGFGVLAGLLAVVLGSVLLARRVRT